MTLIAQYDPLYRSRVYYFLSRDLGIVLPSPFTVNRPYLMEGGQDRIQHSHAPRVRFEYGRQLYSVGRQSAGFAISGY